MIFKELVLENFGAYLGRNVINLNPEKDGESRPIILIGGMNGFGKTTILDSIRLALYGIRAKVSNRGNLNYSRYLMQSIHRSVLTWAGVELVIEQVIDRKVVELKVSRKWEWYDLDSKNLDHYREKLRVIENGVSWKQEEIIKRFQEYIERIFPIGISDLFLFDGEQIKELAESKKITDEVAEGIKSILGLGLISNLSKDLNSMVNGIVKKRAKTPSLEKINSIEERIRVLKEKEIEVNSRLDSLFSEKEKAEKQASNQKTKVSKIKLQFSQSSSSKEKNKLKEKKRDRALVRKSLEYLVASKLPLVLIKNLLRDAITQGTQEIECKKAKIILNVIRLRDRRLLNYVYSIMSDEESKKIEDYLEEDNQELVEKASAVPMILKMDFPILERLKKIVDVELASQQRMALEKMDLLASMEADMEEIETRIMAVDLSEEYDRILEEFSAASQKTADLNKAIIEAQKERKEINKQLVLAKKQLSVYVEEEMKRQEEVHLLQSVDKIRENLIKYKEKIIIKKISSIEEEVTSRFKYLLHKPDLINSVMIEPKKFKISVYDKSKKLLPKNRLSAGEKQLLAIALLWGLASVSNYRLPIVIDTPLARLDSSHQNNLLEYYFPNASHQVILLCTDAELGGEEVAKLRNLDVIAREYLLNYDKRVNHTTISNGYF